MRNTVSVLAMVLCFSFCSFAGDAVKLSDHVTVTQGPINGVFIEKDGCSLVVYGDPLNKVKNAQMLLFTHGRRDIAWAGLNVIQSGSATIVVAPDGEVFETAGKFWNDQTIKRFHDYAQQTTKILTEPVTVNRKVTDGDSFKWKGIDIKVLSTPGYTPASASYIMQIDGKKYAFVGDIIYANGQLLDLYSMQNEVPEAGIRGYHGYAGRMSKLIESLKKVAAQNPDIIVPARGPVIYNTDYIELLIRRLQKVYSNYLSINAGHWYFKGRYNKLAEMVLGNRNKVDWMEYAAVIETKPPEWIIPLGNSRLIVSEDGTGFLIDCGSTGIITQVIKLLESGRVKKIEGLYITHYHDDHTDQVNAALQKFGCPVYSCPNLADILENPAAYRMPAMTSNPIKGITVLPDGYNMRWKEFEFTSYDFPGQTIYHGALLVNKDEAEKIFFIGDSFTPSGIDDYCLLNRNLMHEQMGYLYCLKMLKKIHPQTLLINQHVLEPFRFCPKQIDHMITTLQKRKELIGLLVPWVDANYGIDEGWARFYPYGSKSKPGETFEIELRIFNHFNRMQQYTLTPHVPKGFSIQPARAVVNVPPWVEGPAAFKVTIPTHSADGPHVITADVQFEDIDLRHWCEALIEVGP